MAAPQYMIKTNEDAYVDYLLALVIILFCSQKKDVNRNIFQWPLPILILILLSENLSIGCIHINVSTLLIIGDQIFVVWTEENL